MKLRYFAPLLFVSFVYPGGTHAVSGDPFTCYRVPAISSVPRLPDRLPSDAKRGTELFIVAAKGEFEPASFIISPHVDLAKVVLEPSPLVGKGEEIPALNVDIKIVKTWYQGGTAWYSYFGDSNRRELIPELLLNDETLVKVDTEKQENYLRVGNEYRWISYPKEKAEKEFNYLTEPVSDSKTLQPIRLEAGKNKQIWVTVKVPEDAAAGIYRGNINLIVEGKAASSMKLAVKVLPFSLPAPKTYYDLRNDYLVTLYGTGVLDIAKRLGIPPAVAEAQQKAIYKNLIDHNVINIRSELTLKDTKDRAEGIANLKEELRMMKEAGVTMKPLLSRGWSYYGPGEEKNIERFKQRIDDLAETLREAVGHDDIYVTSWDEAGVERIKVMRELTEYTQSKGLKLWVTTAKDRHFNLAGYLIDYADHGGWPTRENAAIWHSIGAKVASYASPHTGPENPDIFRRWEGLARYKANYDGSYNYKYFTQFNPATYRRLKSNVWNDFMGEPFRQFNLVYPTIDGVIDTLAWEGFREGIDDVRYATKLKQEAEKAIASKNPVAIRAAKKALIWLELLNDQTADLNEARQEMIEHILKIQQAMEENV